MWFQGWHFVFSWKKNCSVSPIFSPKIPVFDKNVNLVWMYVSNPVQLGYVQNYYLSLSIDQGSVRANFLLRSTGSLPFRPKKIRWMWPSTNFTLYLIEHWRLGENNSSSSLKSWSNLSSWIWRTGCQTIWSVHHPSKCLSTALLALDSVLIPLVNVKCSKNPEAIRLLRKRVELGHHCYFARASWWRVESGSSWSCQ